MEPDDLELAAYQTRLEAGTAGKGLIVSLGLFGAFGSSGFEGVATPLHIVVVPNVQNVRKERRLGTTERVSGPEGFYGARAGGVTHRFVDHFLVAHSTLAYEVR